MRKKLWWIIPVYVAMSFLTYCASLANLQGNTRRWAGPILAKKECRGDMGFAAAWSAFPPSWLIIIPISGFYEFGLQMSCERYTEEDWKKEEK